jgi:predicted RNA-binding protein with PUA-like domain
MADKPAGEHAPGHWLLKSEPKAYSWADLVRDGRTQWTGVRNHQAAIYLRAMRKGDLGLFYHSNQGLEVVGVFEVAAEYYPDPTDEAGRFVAVDITPRQALAMPVTLALMKVTPSLRDMTLFRQFRLSVVPVSPAEWATIMALSAAS